MSAARGTRRTIVHVDHLHGGFSARTGVEGMEAVAVMVVGIEITVSALRETAARP